MKSKLKALILIVVIAITLQGCVIALTQGTNNTVNVYDPDTITPETNATVPVKAN